MFIKPTKVQTLNDVLVFLIVITFLTEKNYAPKLLVSKTIKFKKLKITLLNYS